MTIQTKQLKPHIWPSMRRPGVWVCSVMGVSDWRIGSGVSPELAYKDWEYVCREHPMCVPELEREVQASPELAVPYGYTAEELERDNPYNQGCMTMPDRQAFESWHGPHYLSRCNTPDSDFEAYQDPYTDAQWRAWQAAVLVKRKAQQEPTMTCKNSIGKALYRERVQDEFSGI